MVRLAQDHSGDLASGDAALVEDGSRIAVMTLLQCGSSSCDDLSSSPDPPIVPLPRKGMDGVACSQEGTV